MQLVGADLRLGALDRAVASAGTSSGEISVPRIASSTASVAASNWSVATVQRIRYWISVFGTPALTA